MDLHVSYASSPLPAPDIGTERKLFLAQPLPLRGIYILITIIMLPRMRVPHGKPLHAWQPRRKYARSTTSNLLRASFRKSNYEAAQSSPDAAPGDGLSARIPGRDPSGSTPPAVQALPEEQEEGGLSGWLNRRRRGLRERVSTLGLAAVLAYGLLDGLTKTILFCLAFLAYESQTGLNPTRNWADLVRVYVLMWAGGSVTRPLRLAGAAALVPVMDKVLDGLEARLQPPSRSRAFLLMVLSTAGLCLAAVGALFLSRWVRR